MSRIPSESPSSWGVSPGTKTLHNLWIEISNEESSLSSPICLTVNVATLHMKNNRGATLLESQQLLSGGTNPQELKMMPGESTEDAASRALTEELGEGVKASLLMATYRVGHDCGRRKGVSLLLGLPFKLCDPFSGHNSRGGDSRRRRILHQLTRGKKE